MDPFTAPFLIGLAANLTTKMVEALGTKARRSLAGSEKQQALQRCAVAGITAMAATVAPAKPEQAAHLADLFKKLFDSADVGLEVAELLHGKNLDRPALIGSLQKSGFDPKTLPGFNAEQAVHAFESGFLVAASGEETLQGELQIAVLLKGVGIQAQMRNSLQQMVALLQEGFDSLRLQQGQIQTLVQDKVVQTLQLALPAAGAPTDTLDWEKVYLESLLERCNALDLTPIDDTHLQATTTVEQQNEVQISDVFINLNLKGLTRLPDEDIAAVVRGFVSLDHLEKRYPLKRHYPLKKDIPFDRQVDLGKHERGADEARTPIQAIEATYAVQRLVILGEPGGGKSTLTNHLAAQLAARRLGESVDDSKLPGWPAAECPLPVVIVLRRFAAWLDQQTARRTGNGNVWAYLKQRFEQQGQEEAFPHIKRHLLKEGGVVFFDGLDEIHESKKKPLRTRIVRTIQDFAKEQKACRIVVTCREYAYKKDDAWRLPQNQFPKVELELFNDEQIEQFTTIWYQTVGPQKEWSDDKCRTEAENLNHAIKEYRHLHELGRYPLLLTLMAQVHGRDGYLPKDRADLYERAVNLLLAHWHNPKVRETTDGVRTTEPGLVLQLGVRTEILRHALEEVAFQAHELQEGAQDRGERAADIAREDLRDVLNRELADKNKIDTVMTYIQERAGLLQARDNRTYAFPHRTFQEYLTACHIMRQDDFDELLQVRIERDQAWWSEVFLLAAGRVRKIPRNIADLADALLLAEPTDKTMQPANVALALLVAQALAETDFRKNTTEKKTGRYVTTLQRSEKWLLAAMQATDALSGKERARAGDALAMLGDPRDEVTRIDAMHFCLVPGGPFMMGSDKKEDKNAHGDESPKHENKVLDQDVWLARFPTTVAQYRVFVDESGYGSGDNDWQRDPANRPVRYVSWHDALAFCRWLQERWQQSAHVPPGYRVILPSEAEWDKAARGGLQLLQPHVVLPVSKIAGHKTSGKEVNNPHPARIYTWGQKIDANRLNFSETGVGATSSVGCFEDGMSPYGCEEMSGNIWEWTRSLDYNKFEYPYEPESGCENLKADDETARVFRGGAFFSNLSSVRCAYRSQDNPRFRYNCVGFRVALSPFSDL